MRKLTLPSCRVSYEWSPTSGWIYPSCSKFQAYTNLCGLLAKLSGFEGSHLTSVSPSMSKAWDFYSAERKKFLPLSHWMGTESSYPSLWNSPPFPDFWGVGSHFSSLLKNKKHKKPVGAWVFAHRSQELHQGAKSMTKHRECSMGLWNQVVLINNKPSLLIVLLQSFICVLVQVVCLIMRGEGWNLPL